MTAHDSAPIPEDIQRLILLAIPSLPDREALLQRACDRLATIYSRNLIGVSTPIHTTLNTRARRLAHAFVLWK